MRSKLQNLCETKGVKCEAQYGGVELPEEWPRGSHPYKVVLKFGKRRLTVPFFMGACHSKEPTAADVLSCIVSDARAGDMTFEEFCEEFGYDSDSRKAEKVYAACKAIEPRVRRFLGVDFEEFENAEH